MPEYKVTHRLGLDLVGLGSRPFGGVFSVSAEKAASLHLDENPNLERIDGRVQKSKSKTEPATPDDLQEG